MKLSFTMKAISKGKVLAAILAGMIFATQLAPHVFANSVNAFADQSPVNDRLLAKDPAAGTIELEDAGVVQLASNYKVEQHINGKVISKSLSEVMIGAKNVSFLFDGSSKISKIIMDGHTPVETIRVGIRKNIDVITDYSQFNHTTLSFKAADGFRIVDKKENVEIPVSKDETATFTVADGKITVSIPSESEYSTESRLYLVSDSMDSLIQATAFKRAQGYPAYRGTLEVSLNADDTTMKLVNEVTIEQYLYQVVPSEMPASFGLEALNAQAIAARTYALTDYYSNRFADRGIHIDDSTLSQVYNNTAENTLTTQAVNDTAGKIMKSGEELVDARFYSTSGGYGASKHEVWADNVTQQFPGTPISYLTARSYTFDPNDQNKIMEINTSDEDEINAFYKDLSLLSYDSESLYFRWKVSLSNTQLQNTINKNIKLRYDADPEFILTQTPDGSFKSLPIPTDGIGEFKNMYAAKRGAGGNLTELVIEGTNGTFKILKEFNIRFTIRPNKVDTLSGSDIIAYRAKGGSATYGSPLSNPSILYSAFFTFDMEKDDNDEVTEVTFYGGGNGHGVGMSQYGASMLGGQGWSYSQILNSYYANMRIVDMNETVLTGIALSVPTSLKTGNTEQIVVTALYSDNTEIDVTSLSTFHSSDSSIISVDSNGVLRANKKGSATITTVYEGRTATSEIVVNNVDVPVSPPIVTTPVEKTISDILKAAKDGKAIIDAGKDLNISFPTNASELIGSKGLVEVKIAGVVLTIPSSVFAQLQEAMPKAQEKSEIILTVKSMTDHAAAELLANVNLNKNTNIRLASDIFDFSLAIKSDDQILSVKQFAAPIQVQFQIIKDANRKRTSVFHMKDDGSLERLGLSWNKEGTVVTAMLNHFSKYAALEINKSFEDMKNHWADTVVGDLAALGIVQGVSDSRYEPEKQVSRAEFSALLVRALDLKAKTKSPFIDVPSDAWYADEVAAAYEAGLVLGTHKDRFSPNAKLTREQMAVMLKRAWEFKEQAALSLDSNNLFSDENQISEWAKSAVHGLTEAGLLKGRMNNKFEPRALASRAEVAQVLHNLLYP